MRLSVVLFLFYILALFKVLFFKIRIVFSDIDISGNEKASFHSLFALSNFIPFYRIYYYASGQDPYLVGLLNIAGNILLFIPMGFFLPYFLKRIRQGRLSIIITAFTSLSIEILQLLTATGEFDIDDVLLNSCGGMIGYFLFRYVQRRNFQKKHK